MKFNRFLAIYFVTVIILIGLGYYALDRAKAEIYFNVWLNQIVAKSDSGNLFETHDPEDFIIENHKIGKFLINMEELTSSRIRYYKKTKSLNIFLMIPKVENKTFSFFSFKEIPNSISKKICEDIKYKAVYGSLSNQFTINGEEISPTRFSSFVDSVECYFLANDHETGALSSSGGWKFKISDANEQPSEISKEEIEEY